MAYKDYAYGALWEKMSAKHAVSLAFLQSLKNLKRDTPILRLQKMAAA